MSQLIHPFLSNKVMGAAIAIHKALGAGLLHRAMEESHSFCRKPIMSFELC
jgi:hypothetical protein